MFKTEAEAWEAIADTLEMIEGMPEFLAGGSAAGLGGVVVMLYSDGVINAGAVLEMSDRIQAALGEREWLAKIGEWKPRVIIARKFAEQARNNS